uniref:Alpha,alpha-trehalase n=1 Tax=Macrostomum lignano TaxID=282301 RepID=A0A1I8FJT2_9PLAT
GPRRPAATSLDELTQTRPPPPPSCRCDTPPACSTPPALAGPGQTCDAACSAASPASAAAWAAPGRLRQPGAPNACARCWPPCPLGHAAPPGDLPWRAVPDGPACVPARLTCWPTWPFSPEGPPPTCACCARLSTPTAGKDGEGAFGRAPGCPCLSGWPRSPQNSPPFPSDIMAAAGGCRSCRRIDPVVGAVAMGFAVLLAEFCSADAAGQPACCWLAMCTQSATYLEDGWCCTMSGVCTSECRIYYERNISPELLRLGDRLADVYHDSLLAQVPPSWPPPGPPGCTLSEQALPWMTAVWLTARNGVVDAWQYAEA